MSLLSDLGNMARSLTGQRTTTSSAPTSSPRPRARPSDLSDRIREGRYDRDSNDRGVVPASQRLTPEGMAAPKAATFSFMGIDIPKHNRLASQRITDRGDSSDKRNARKSAIDRSAVLDRVRAIFGKRGQQAVGRGKATTERIAAPRPPASGAGRQAMFGTTGHQRGGAGGLLRRAGPSLPQSTTGRTLKALTGQ